MSVEDQIVVKKLLGTGKSVKDLVRHKYNKFLWT